MFIRLSWQGFFRSLFTSGFVESTPKFGRRLLGPDEIVIVFDDRNITRAGASYFAASPA
jgi:hypothetical protein